MSLRSQLTGLYAIVAGIILLVFGAVTYMLVNVMLIDQVDRSLELTAHQIILQSRVNATGDIEVLEFPSLDVTSTVFVQVWNTTSQLKISSPNIAKLTIPLDAAGLRSTVPVYQSSKINTAPLRVLTVPLQVEDRKVGILQVGMYTGIIEATMQTLIWVQAAAGLLFISMAAIVGWLMTGQALAPLEKATETALSITKADDLSRRIPNPEHSQNEVGILITAFNQTLDRLEQLFTAQKRFVADVSHELRTPLTVIKGNVGLVRKMKKPDEESLQSIESEVDRLTRMVGDLLLLAQAETGKLPLDLRPVELDSLMMEVFHQMKVVAGEKVQLQISEIEPIRVMGDRDRIKQVYLNLIGNAVKYTPAGGTILISMKQSGKMSKTTISDTGPGIPMEDLPHIFERFYRSDKARTRAADGSSFGLGLSIANWIVKNHGGMIDVSSKENNGTTFLVYLPLLIAEQPETAK
jgi:two-component system, OmpR family, sensor kinase